MKNIICMMLAISMMTSSNENIFRVTDLLWEKATGHRWIRLTRPMMQSFDVFFDLRLNKRLSKHARRQWFQTPSGSIWRHSNDFVQDSIR